MGPILVDNGGAEERAVDEGNAEERAVDEGNDDLGNDDLTVRALRTYVAMANLVNADGDLSWGTLGPAEREEMARAREALTVAAERGHAKAR